MIPTTPPPPRVLMRGEQSDGRVSVSEITMPARAAGPPLHRHAFDEVFYVLEGELTIQVGRDLLTAGRGELVHAPSGVPHTLANRSSATVRCLVVCAPAGFERELARRAAERTGTEPPAWARRSSPEVAVVGPRIGVASTGARP